MSNPFEIIKDSSIWQNSNIYGAVTKKDPYIRIGIVKKIVKDERTSDFRYLVEIQDRNDSIEVNARMMRRFGGVYNYDDAIYHGYKHDDKPDPVRAFDAKAGDSVIVAFLNGEAREAVILGGLIHSARKTTLDVTKGPQLKSEFNGIETHINEFGEYTLTFKALPTNIAKLEDVPSKLIESPTYDTKVGTSYLKFDKTGSFEINDNSQDKGFQKLRIDKTNGTFTVNSGNIQLTLSKKEEAVSIVCKTINTAAKESISAKTKKYKMEAETSTSIKSPKVAIGKDGVELLDQLFKMIEKLGMVKPISPVGPCTPLMATPEWSEVKQIQSKIKEITGNL